MTTQTSIEWTEQTWNPTTGCTKISPGCKHCYAEVMARRLHAMGAPGYENGFKLAILPARLVQPLQRKKPTVYFVNSMSDLFHEEIPDDFLDQVFDVIRRTPQQSLRRLPGGQDGRNWQEQRLEDKTQWRWRHVPLPRAQTRSARYWGMVSNPSARSRLVKFSSPSNCRSAPTMNNRLRWAVSDFLISSFCRSTSR